MTGQIWPGLSRSTLGWAGGSTELVVPTTGQTWDMVDEVVVIVILESRWRGSQMVDETRSRVRLKSSVPNGIVSCVIQPRYKTDDDTRIPHSTSTSCLGSST